MKVANLADLKREVSQLISNSENEKFPATIIFNRGIDFSQFKITIEEEEVDFFVDAKGETWKKVKQ